MSIRSTLKDIIPPVLLRTGRKLMSSNRVYESYNDALRACTSAGYEDPYLIKTVYEETKEYLRDQDGQTVVADNTLAHILMAFSFLGSKPIVNIIDAGGSCGIHYFPVSRLLGNRFSFRWHIAETPSLVGYAREFENEELKFFTGISQAAASFDNVDLIISSGAIQYMSDPRKALKEMIATQAEFILLTRLSLSTTDHDIITVQKSLLSENSFEKMPEGFRDRIITYPHTNMKESDFLEIISANYKIRLHIQDNSGLQDFKNNCKGYGLLLQRL